MVNKSLCQVPGCPSRAWKNHKLSFFRFPKQENRCREWIQRIDPTLSTKPFSQVNAYRVCAVHFTDDQFMNIHHNSLIHCAIPSLHLPVVIYHVEDPATSTGELVPGTRSGEPVPGTSRGDPVPGTRSGEPVPGTRRGEPVPGTRRGEPVPGTRSGEPVPGTRSGEPVPGTRRGEPVPGTRRGEPVPGTRSGEPVPGTPRGQSDSMESLDVTTTDVFMPSASKKRKGISNSSFSGSGLVSMQKKSRRRLLQELELCRDEITPRKKRILNFTRKLQDNFRQLNKRVKSTRGKMKELLKIQNCNSMKFFLHHDVSPTAAVLACGDARNRRRKLKSRRWTRQEKLFALALYRRSPKAYNFLSELIALPCRSTLTVLLSSVPFDVGINQQVITHLGQEVQKMDNRDKYCALYFDEMSLRSGVYYNEPVDLVDGFEDFGTLGRTSRQADHALVFMVRGLYTKWKQPVAYYLCQATTPTRVLKELIVLVIRALSSVGIYIKATVCDQGPTNRSSVSELVKDFPTGRTNDTFAFQVDGELIVTVFDAPHLLKSMRNNFIKYDVVSTGGTAKWEHLEILGKMNSTHLFNLIKKLTPEHLNPVGKDKMRVYYAAQVFSHSCWAGINLLINSPLQEMPAEAVVTADFLLFMNNLFDSLNGTTSKSQLTSPLRCWLTKNSGHSEFWGDALKKMSNLSFVDRTTGKVSHPPCQVGWVTTIRAVQLLWSDLQKKGFKHLQLRSLNQDGIENLFSIIRQHGGENNNPTAGQFRTALKTCIVNGFCSSRSKGKNCEVDSGELLSKLDNFLGASPGKSQTGKGLKNTVHCTNISTISGESIVNPNNIVDITDVPTFVQGQSIAYVSGFIAKKLLNGTCKDCEVCRLNLTSQPEQVIVDGKVEIHSIIEARDIGGRLKHPSVELGNCVSKASDVAMELLPNILHLEDVGSKLSFEIRRKSNFEWVQCVNHRDQLIQSFLVLFNRISIHQYCKQQNRKPKLLARLQASAKRIRIFKHV